MFAESTRVCLYERSIYLYIMNISLSRPFSTLFHLFLISIILDLYTEKENTLSRTFFILSRHFLTFILFYYIYSIYREEHTFPPFPYPFPHSFIILLIYRRGNTFSRPFLYLFEMLLMGKVRGKSF